MAHETLRGLIVEFLHKVYPHMVLELDLIKIFYHYHRDKEIKQALAFLVDSSYVEKVEKAHPVRRFEKQEFYKLTRDGVMIADGSKRDDAVLVDCER